MATSMVRLFGRRYKKSPGTNIDEEKVHMNPEVYMVWFMEEMTDCLVWEGRADIVT